MESEKVLSAEDIRRVDDRQAKAVKIPEWGGTVYVRRWSGYERGKYLGLSQRAGTDDSATARVLGYGAAISLSDASGTRMFADSDADMLGTRDGVALEKLLQAAMELNGLSDTAVEDAEKN